MNELSTNPLQLDAADTQRSAGCAPTSGSGSPVLATRDGVSLVFGLLLASGCMCDECGYATRKTSKNWAVCKKCGKRIPRCEISEVKVTNDGQNANMEAPNA